MANWEESCSKNPDSTPFSGCCVRARRHRLTDCAPKKGVELGDATAKQRRYADSTGSAGSECFKSMDDGTLRASVTVDSNKCAARVSHTVDLTRLGRRTIRHESFFNFKSHYHPPQSFP